MTQTQKIHKGFAQGIVQLVSANCTASSRLVPPRILTSPSYSTPPRSSLTLIAVCSGSGSSARWSSLTEFFSRLSRSYSTLLPHCLGTKSASTNRVTVDPLGFKKYWDLFGLGLEMLVRQDQRCEMLKTPGAVRELLKDGLELDVVTGQGTQKHDGMEREGPDGLKVAEEIWPGIKEGKTKDVLRIRGGAGTRSRLQSRPQNWYGDDHDQDQASERPSLCDWALGHLSPHVPVSSLPSSVTCCLTKLGKLPYLTISSRPFPPLAFTID